MLTRGRIGKRLRGLEAPVHCVGRQSKALKVRQVPHEFEAGELLERRRRAIAQIPDH